MMFGTHERFDYVECASCACLQIAVVPPDLQRFYPPDYHRRIPFAAEAGAIKRLARRLSRACCVSIPTAESAWRD
ncbi:MAG: hypothetical protein WDO24_19095 [Pseudomonadota bacterium]